MPEVVGREVVMEEEEAEVAVVAEEEAPEAGEVVDGAAAVREWVFYDLHC